MIGIGGREDVFGGLGVGRGGGGRLAGGGDLSSERDSPFVFADCDRGHHRGRIVDDA